MIFYLASVLATPHVYNQNKLAHSTLFRHHPRNAATFPFDVLMGYMQASVGMKGW